MVMFSLLLALVCLLTGIFVLINLPLWQSLFTTELVVIALLVLLFLALAASLQSAARARFLLRLFFVCSTANAVLLYLTTVRSIAVLFLGIISLAGLFTSILGKKQEKKKEKLRSKKEEVSRQLGPEEEEPKVVVLKKKKRKSKKR